jgi:hypothetical protein
MEALTSQAERGKLNRRKEMSYSPQQASAQKKKRDLEREVLTHLKTYGALLYDTLYVRFDLAHTGAIQPVLRDLNEYGYIEVNNDKMVTITTFGLDDLKGKEA